MPSDPTAALTLTLFWTSSQSDDRAFLTLVEKIGHLFAERQVPLTVATYRSQSSICVQRLARELVAEVGLALPAPPAFPAARRTWLHEQLCAVADVGPVRTLVAPDETLTEHADLLAKHGVCAVCVAAEETSVGLFNRLLGRGEKGPAPRMIRYGQWLLPTRFVTVEQADRQLGRMERVGLTSGQHFCVDLTKALNQFGPAVAAMRRIADCALSISTRGVASLETPSGYALALTGTKRAVGASSILRAA